MKNSDLPGNIIMDIWQLHIFCKVVELRSFSNAAKAVRLSQPTVSTHIQELEAHFKTRLIDRSSREAHPTKAGQILYAYARKILALRDETEAAVAEFQGEIRGRLIIGGSTIPGAYLLPRIISEFIREYPDVTISLHIGDTEKIINDIISGVSELGVVGAKTGDKKIVQEMLADDELRLVVWADHPWASEESVSLKMLMTAPFIVREQGSGTLKSLKESIRSAGCDMDDFRIMAEMGSTEAVVQGIKARLGVSILSVIAVSEELACGALKAISIEGLNLKRSFYLTTPKQRSLSPLAEAFISFIRRKLTHASFLP